jgi:hypothetical protein
MSSVTSPEAGMIDPISLLQDRLGIDEEQARDLVNVQVACPIPGQDREASLGEFMTSEHGAEKAEQIVDIATQARERGAEPEEALAQALGFAAVRDQDTGGLARVKPPESKKK